MHKLEYDESRITKPNSPFQTSLHQNSIKICSIQCMSTSNMQEQLVYEEVAQKHRISNTCSQHPKLEPSNTMMDQ